jgi:hypothetical protein
MKTSLLEKLERKCQDNNIMCCFFSAILILLASPFILSIGYFLGLFAIILTPFISIAALM